MPLSARLDVELMVIPYAMLLVLKNNYILCIHILPTLYDIVGFFG